MVLVIKEATEDYYCSARKVVVKICYFGKYHNSKLELMTVEDEFYIDYIILIYNQTDGDYKT